MRPHQDLRDIDKLDGGHGVSYPIAEVFFSWQAEGFHAGLPTVFVRFAGCNYKCSWCDTDFTLKERLSLKELTSRINRAAPNVPFPPSVCFTGGEPCLHDLFPIMRALDAQCPRLYQIETNGSQAHVQYMGPGEFYTYVTVSPKQRDGAPVAGGDYVCDQLKVVYQGQDLDEFTAKDRRGKMSNFAVQPLYADGGMNWQASFDAACRSVLPWRLSFQTNKWVGAR